MSVTRLAQIYNPLVFEEAEQEKQIQLNAFIQSGIMTVDPRLTAMASTGGNIGELSFYKPLGNSEPNYSNDNPAENSTTENIDSDKMIYRLASQNKSWSVMDLARELALADPVEPITSSIAGYWATANERRLIQSTVGILNSNVANNSSDMVVSVATDGSGAITANELISSDLIIDAKQTSGDHQFDYAAIALHSVVYSRLQKAQLIDDIRDADNNTMFQVFGNLRVIVDDSLPAVVGSNRVTYTSILFGTGGVVSGFGRTSVPSELDRKPSAGNGGGQLEIYSRRADIIHPLGFKFNSAAVDDQSATLAELATAANWTRVWDRKNVPMAFIQTNG